MGEELYKAYRPQEFEDVQGQPEVTRVLADMVARKSVPHTIALVGESGCGKTTIARILRRKLGCGDADYVELNAAQARGIDTVRDIQTRVTMMPISGRCRVWLIDEAHGLTAEAQEGLLKLLEDTPKRCYFILCTTAPSRLKKTIRSRCTEFVIKPLGPAALGKVVSDVCNKEDIQITEEVADKLIAAAAGSARKVLVLLDAIRNLADDEEQLQFIEKADVEIEAVKICKALFDSRTKWPDMAAILKPIKEAGEDPEGLRHLILAWSTTILLGGGKMAPRAADVIGAFSANLWDAKFAGLAVRCYDLICPPK